MTVEREEHVSGHRGSGVFRSAFLDFLILYCIYNLPQRCEEHGKSERQRSRATPTRMTTAIELSLGSLSADSVECGLRLQAKIGVSLGGPLSGSHQSQVKSLQDVSSLSSWVDQGRVHSFQITVFLNDRLLRNDMQNLGFLKDLKKSIRNAKARSVPEIQICAYELTVVEAIES